MKNLILSAIVMAFVFSACSSNTNETKKETVTTNETQLYACSMHPEITGKKDDKCSKCGMELSVPVAASEAAHDDNGSEHHHDDATTNETATPKDFPFSYPTLEHPGTILVMGSSKLSK